LVDEIYGTPGESRTHGTRFRNTQTTYKLLNKLSVSQLAQLSKFSKSYISQVKNGKCQPSQKLLDIITESDKHVQTSKQYFDLFMQSRRAKEVSATTLRFYQQKLGRFLTDIDASKAKPKDIEKFLLQFPNPGNRHGYYQVIKSFYKWLKDIYDVPDPTIHISAPKVGKLILPSLTTDQVLYLINTADNVRTKAIIAVLTESGLRLSELAGIKLQNINWENRTVQVIGKGKKEALAPFGDLSETYLKQWLSQYKSNGIIWDINSNGIRTMLNRLEAKTGITCNPHTFRRTFAVLLRKAGIDTMTIKELGRWESLERVQRYTRSFSFQDSMKFYRSPLN
jgi:site-specific recombinase XerD